MPLTGAIQDGVLTGGISMASIGLRQRVFTVGHSPFAHNYLVLYDDRGNVAGELHGFAADPVTGEESLFGRSTHNLKAFDYTGKKWYRENEPEQVLWQGSHDDAMARWQAARAVHDEINRRNLTYNFWGSDLNGPRDWDAPVPDVIAGNSNSVNSTFLDAMGLRLPSMPTMAPGTENPLLRQQQIEQIRKNNGLPIPKGGLF
jgi:hypothetical protein